MTHISENNQEKSSKSGREDLWLFILTVAILVLVTVILGCLWYIGESPVLLVSIPMILLIIVVLDWGFDEKKEKEGKFLAECNDEVEKALIDLCRYYEGEASRLKNENEYLKSLLNKESKEE